jgi:hypothetical protein
MVGTGLGVRLNGNGTGPDLLCPNPCEVDCGRTAHSERLWGVGVEGVARNDGDTVITPIGFRHRKSHQPFRCFGGFWHPRPALGHLRILGTVLPVGLRRMPHFRRM